MGPPMHNRLFTGALWRSIRIRSRTLIIKEESMTSVTGAQHVDVAGFKESLKGQLLAPGDSEYDVVRTVWNAMIDRHPMFIARCVDVDDVVQAATFARANNLLVSVRGGGHNVAGKAVC